MNLVERVKGILLQPKSEWSAIEGEPVTAGYLISNYVAIVAAIPAVYSFIGTPLIGVGGYRIGIGLGLASAIVLYVLSLIGVFILAYVIDFLAGTFGARKSFLNRDEDFGLRADRRLGGRHIQHHSVSVLPQHPRFVQLLHTGITGLMRPPSDKAII